MATDLLSADLESDDEAPHRARSPLAENLRSILKPLASLKLTVTLFALAIFLVLAGTLAQARHDTSWVVDNYFSKPLAWIDFNVFFPPAWFADYPSLLNVSGAFPFPGFITIGALMALNLLAAHGIRFKIQARGARLWSGLGVIAVGCVLTWLVIAAGPGKDGSQATAPLDWLSLWRLFLLGLACVNAGIAAALFVIPPARSVERTVLGCVGAALLGLLAYLLLGVNVRALDPSAMRILWQLLMAEFAALVLLAGCVMVFRKRGGIVLLHAGVGLLLTNALVVHFLHKEGQMTITDGGTANFTVDVRHAELAIVDTKTDPKADRVTVVPDALLQRSFENRETITDARLPFDVRVVRYYDNARLTKLPSDELNRADSGAGRREVAVAMPERTGADSGDNVDLPASYVEFTDKASGKSLGTYLFSILLNSQRVTVGQMPYDVALRFERDYKPYSIHLYEVREDLYLGTSIPKSYSSTIQLVDKTRDVDARKLIRMNEPLRYGGETFYQSGNPEPGVTVLQVVANTGWMIPYVACMVVITGVLSQFLVTLSRFLRRRSQDALSGPPPLPSRGNGQSIAPPTSSRMSAFIVPAVLVGLFLCCVMWSAALPQRSANSFDFYAAGKLPVVYGGRVQPLDTVARNTLRMISGREVFADNSGQTQPAMRWLMDVIARPEVAADYRLFRIDTPEVRDMLGLERRPPKSLFGKLIGEAVQRYSPSELAAHADEFRAQAETLRQRLARGDKQLTTVEKKVLELSERAEIYQSVADAFHLSPELKTELAEPMPATYLKLVQQQFSKAGINVAAPYFPTKDEMRADRDKAIAAIRFWVELEQKLSYDSFLRKRQPPLVVPSPESRDPKAEIPADDPHQWLPYAAAFLDSVTGVLSGEQPNPALGHWEGIIEAYAAQDAAEFNSAVDDYAASLAHQPPRQLAKSWPDFEVWFNHLDPFFLTQWFYLLAFFLVAFFWLFGWKSLNQAAFWLILALLVVHTLSLVARMTISGRPPVTNLYSTALFIGWAAVLLGVILELVYYRLGFGAAIAAISGFATLIIADKLSLVVDSETRGDTIGVMRAVLDTQFWLSLHVTTINLGYATTYVAGLLAIAFVIGDSILRVLTADARKLLARMIYGALCFAMFFSFFGTVLGGLWADDSWGRFWGWDPKENGALIIVLWNALVLHARWDGLVKERGLALLALGGNIATTWSYFGVNQLGVGLHSYGFTEGVLPALSIFCASQILLIVAGIILPRFWRSRAAAATS
jgi:ABC-type transport system involved in cytochrome c biogenesis permease subunit